jgi:hypothetical protein
MPTEQILALLIAERDKLNRGIGNSISTESLVRRACDL